MIHPRTNLDDYQGSLNRVYTRGLEQLHRLGGCCSFLDGSSRYPLTLLFGRFISVGDVSMGLVSLNRIPMKTMNCLCMSTYAVICAVVAKGLYNMTVFPCICLYLSEGCCPRSNTTWWAAKWFFLSSYNCKMCIFLLVLASKSCCSSGRVCGLMGSTQLSQGTCLTF